MPIESASLRRADLDLRGAGMVQLQVEPATLGDEVLAMARGQLRPAPDPGEPMASGVGQAVIVPRVEVEALRRVGVGAERKLVERQCDLHPGSSDALLVEAQLEPGSDAVAILVEKVDQVRLTGQDACHAIEVASAMRSHHSRIASSFAVVPSQTRPFVSMIQFTSPWLVS